MKLKTIKIGTKFQWKRPWGIFNGIWIVCYVGKVVVKCKRLPDKWSDNYQEWNFVKSLIYDGEDQDYYQWKRAIKRNKCQTKNKTKKT